MQVVLAYPQPFRRNLLLECALQPEIAKIIYQNLLSGGSGSFKVIDVDKSE